MKNIAKAIIQVMAEVKGMEKNSKVGTGQASYDGTKDQDVKEVFNNALQKNGLCILPIDIQESTQIDRWEETSQYGVKQKQSVFTKVNVKYMLLHESGESIELAGYGHGIDAQDKGAGKATTYALKNCLLYTFLTPVGKIDDTDLKHSNDIEVPQKSAPKVIEVTELDWINLEAIFESKSEVVPAEKFDAIKSAVYGRNNKFYEYTLATLQKL
tara:strand:- start:899 stop:1537 length:639 start_codon:yes stop_codon:yes gene_type:complete